MKKFVTILKDKRAARLTHDLLQAHVDHLKSLSEEGTLQICGPFARSDKAMQILIADSVEEATALVQKDPFVVSGYYASYDLFELVEANASNNWLMNIPPTTESGTASLCGS